VRVLPFVVRDVVVELIFLLDICINFNVGLDLLHEESLITDRRVIAVTYAKSWLFCDVMSSIPFTIIGLVGGTTTGGIRSLQILRSLKLLKVVRLVHSFIFLNAVLKPSTCRLLAYVLVSSYVVHWTGCAYWALAQSMRDDAGDYWGKQYTELYEESFAAQYSAAIYW
jgi:hypothetical protein